MGHGGVAHRLSRDALEKYATRSVRSESAVLDLEITGAGFDQSHRGDENAVDRMRPVLEMAASEYGAIGRVREGLNK